MDSYVLGPNGLEPREKQVPRSKEERLNSRENLIRAYEAAHLENESKVNEEKKFWCRILGRWVKDIRVYFLSPLSKALLCDEFFGLVQRKSSERPCIAWPFPRFLEVWSEGIMVIVPDVPIHATAKEISQWRRKDVKEFKIRIIDPENKKAIEMIPGLEPAMCWRDLDNKRLEFKGSCRPAEKFLFSHYMRELYWRGFNYISGGIAYEPFWKVEGNYVSKAHVRGYVEGFQHLGAGYEGLMIGACGQEELEMHDLRQRMDELIEREAELRTEAEGARIKKQRRTKKKSRR